jgi:putative tricarboxylic transport membrane protein
MRLSDRFTGLFLVALGAAAAYGGSRLPPVPGQQIGPNVFPLVVGIGLCLCGILIAARVGSGFEEAVEINPAEPSAGPATDPVPSRFSWMRLLLPPASLIFYALAVDALGFFLTAGTMILVASLAFGARLRLAGPLALLMPPFIHLVFYKLLRVPLPAGLVPMPW